MGTGNQPRRRPRSLTRRGFLRVLAASGAGLVVVCGGLATVGLPRVREMFNELPPLSDDPNAWFQITPANQVLLTLNKIEMGQGIGTAAAQILADQLDIAYDAVVLAPTITTNMPGDFIGTGGSLSVIQLYAAFRQGGATARQALRELAAERTGRPVDQFVTRAGRVNYLGDPSLSFSYGELLEGKRIIRSSSAAAAPKAIGKTASIGRSLPRRDLFAKVTGQPIYADDLQLPGMLVGRVVRPPVFGATVGDVDLSPARSLPGVVAVVHDGAFIGVAAETMEQAAAAVGAIEVRWQMPAALLQQEEIEALLVSERSPTILKAVGVAPATLRNHQSMTRQYQTGFLAHAQIEPMVGVADVQDEHVIIWAPAQAPLSLRDQVASAIGRSADQVVVHATMIGGGFGRKSTAEAAIEAARLSLAAGRPVKVIWNRFEEFQHDYPQPITATDLTASVDARGQIVAWDQHLATGYVFFSFFPAALRLLSGTDGGATRAAVGPYAIPNLQVAATVRDLPVATGTWRGLGLLPNVFALEQFIDELADSTGSDPVAFRLRHLPEDAMGGRLRRVIETAAAAAEWGSPMPADHGRGIACSADAETVVAEVVELRIDRASGAVTVLRVVAAVDCGLVINPDSATAQIEGAIVMGLSAALTEELTVRDGRWSAGSFAEYPIATINQVPAISITLIDNHDTAPGGLGEPPIGPIGAAVANAIAAAAGVRVRRMPMTPQRIRDALARQQEESATDQEQKHMAQFPHVTGSNLSGKSYTLPQDFEGAYNLVLLAYLQEQQYTVDTWLPAVRQLEAEYAGLHYYELPVLPQYNWIQRRYTDNGMRAGIPDRSVRDRIITLYLDVAAFNEALNLTSTQTIHILLVDRQGRVLWQTEGPYTEEKRHALVQALRDNA